jgi:hypothetical protein
MFTKTYCFRFCSSSRPDSGFLSFTEAVTRGHIVSGDAASMPNDPLNRAVQFPRQPVDGGLLIILGVGLSNQAVPKGLEFLAEFFIKQGGPSFRQRNIVDTHGATKEKMNKQSVGPAQTAGPLGESKA